ncbi:MULTISPECIES: phosphotransferase family protein [Mycobacteriaceae]|uniref:Phosphotransferase family protein n=1 Tax=Mycolicibacterium mucogenicum DSM 44124 TaxID=1226753 RepID=A0A8H2PIF7_MYCMU|nr:MULTISPECIES: phosphotransferase family protein [Mycobacteriaceae]KAB7760378.1 acyl-CoA dehydrogenase [Mycolicibacterium mucogenicum DSM 44124]QPG67535.1 phosphotransferase family protein [Mycolicibacterium mucogenicum DSM 44124]SEA36529.1 Predicted kinase, aminoglycoside phosphotransferase (APT) family [Mycobacterium sp. 283mftsu]
MSGVFVIDVARLADWLDRSELPGAGEPLQADYLSGGTQNVIYRITRGDHTCVLRMPPSEAPADRDKGILREWRIIEALDGTDVPHTAAVGVCEDASVLGRPFYLMGYVDGWSPMDRHGVWPDPFGEDIEARAGLSYQLAEGIALLSKVDWKAKGLHDLGRPDGFHERQVDRWISFFERIKGREIDGLDVTTEWLRNHRPLDFIPGLMHGDYQFANVMYRHGAPATMAAIVDWEMGTVGDPKLDLGWMVQSWPENTRGAEVGEATDSTGMNYVDMRGMPSRTAVVDHYAKVSGRQVDDLDYYLVLAKWKLAIVLEQGFQRAGDNEKLLAYGPVITALMREAAELAESSDYR